MKLTTLSNKTKSIEESLKLKEDKSKRLELSKAKSDQAALQKRLQVVVSAVSVKRGVSASVQLAAVTPDPDHTYRLTYGHDRMSHDKVEIRTTASGLLKSISTTARDESITLVKEAIDVAGDAAVFVATGGIQSTLPTQIQLIPPVSSNGCATEKNFSATFLMNPILHDGVGSYSDVSKKLNRLSSTQQNCFSVRVYDALLRLAKPLPKKTHCDDSAKAMDPGSSCIFYRRLGVLFIDVTHEGLDELTDLIMVEVPQAGPTGAIEIARRAFVENVAEATFQNGMLTRVKYTEPSQTKAVASAPFDLLREIFSIPAAIVDTKRSRLDSQAKMLNAHAALIEAQIQLEEARARIREQQTASDTQ